MSAGPAFPNYMQMRPRVPVRAWHAIRLGSVSATLALCACLVVAPDAGFFVFWGLVIPLLPLVFFLAPGLWRNVCPLAAVNQVPRLFGLSRGRTLPPGLRRYGYLIAVALFLGGVLARRSVLEESGTALAALLLGTLGLALIGGLLFKGKSGWCSTFCPLLPVQRVYGQTPFKLVRNSHCEPCVGCTMHCYDFNPHVAELADLHDDDRQMSGYRKLFVGAFPGVVLAFYTLDGSDGTPAMYAAFGLFVLASVGSFAVLDVLLGLSAATLAVVYAAIALNAYYWFNVPLLAERLVDGSPWWVVWPSRALLLALTLVWIERSRSKERRFLEETDAPLPIRLGAAAEGALRKAGAGDRPEVVLMPGNRKVAVAEGTTLLEIVERAGLPIEAGCRMGFCGADPVGVADGAENLSPVGADEAATIGRLGLGGSTRMACCARVHGPATVSLEPEARRAAPAVASEAVDPSIGHVVVIGNGIAGITAAEHVRRRQPGCEIAVVGREPHHLYNRMAITRLVYGRSAMQGLYLQPDRWYDEQRLMCWLNTRAVQIQRAARSVALATGETLPYDRLILATGSRSIVPPVDGFEARGVYVLREAADAIRLRADVQEHGPRAAVVVGGGLLGLETAYALRKLGLQVTVLERSGWPLRRQLDERGGAYLARFMGSFGLELLMRAEVASVQQSDGRVAQVTLRDGRELACGVVVVSAGIVPNAEIAQTAALEVARGVIVDDSMRTSDPDIFAVGDVAEHRGVVTGLWPTAVEQAQVAAANALGGDERFVGAATVAMLKVTGVELLSVGRFEATSEDEEEIVFEDPAEGRYRKLVVASGRIVGGILVGYAREAPGLTAAVREGRDVGPVLDELRAGDWSSLEARVTAAAAA